MIHGKGWHHSDSILCVTIDSNTTADSDKRPCTFSFWWDTSSAQCGTIVYAVFVCLSMLHGWHGLVAEALFRAIESVYITYGSSATPIADAER